MIHFTRPAFSTLLLLLTYCIQSFDQGTIALFVRTVEFADLHLPCLPVQITLNGDPVYLSPIHFMGVDFTLPKLPPLPPPPPPPEIDPDDLALMEAAPHLFAASSSDASSLGLTLPLDGSVVSMTGSLDQVRVPLTVPSCRCMRTGLGCTCRLHECLSSVLLPPTAAKGEVVGNLSSHALVFLGHGAATRERQR